MELAKQFLGATFADTELNAAGRNITAYAALNRNQLLIAVFNKTDTAVEAQILNHNKERIQDYRELRAPALNSKQDVTFADAPIPAQVYRPYVAANRVVLLQLTTADLN